MLYRHRKLRPWLWRIWFTSGLVAWMVMIFFVSSLSREELGRGGTFQEEPITYIGGGMPSLPVHLIMYAVLAWLVQATLLSFNNSTGRIWPGALVAATFAILYAITDEVHQSFVDGRYSSATHVYWDALGAVSAAATLGYLISNRPRLRGQLARWLLPSGASSLHDP